MNEPVNITVSNARICLLRELVSLRAGYSFRSAIPEVAGGDVMAVQLRDIQQEKLNWSTVVRTQLDRPPASAEWLRPGDILFAFRGTRYFAIALPEVPERVVASTQFMLLRVQKPQGLLPEFLAWQLNQSPAQTYFSAAAEGTAQKSLRRAVLEMAQVAVPPVSVQHAVAEMVGLARRERDALTELIQIRQQQLNCIAVSLMQSAEEGASI